MPSPREGRYVNTIKRRDTAPHFAMAQIDSCVTQFFKRRKRKKNIDIHTYISSVKTVIYYIARTGNIVWEIEERQGESQK